MVLRFARWQKIHGKPSILLPKHVPGLAFNAHAERAMKDGRKGVPHRTVGHWTNPAEHGRKQQGSGPIWFDRGIAKHSSKSNARKAASAHIAKIPLGLARFIAKTYKP